MKNPEKVLSHPLATRNKKARLRAWPYYRFPSKLRKFVISSAVISLLGAAAIAVTIGNSSFESISSREQYSGEVYSGSLNGGLRQKPTLVQMAPPMAVAKSMEMLDNDAAVFESMGEGGRGDKDTMGGIVLAHLQAEQQTNTPTSDHRMLVYNGYVAGKVPPSKFETTIDEIVAFVEQEAEGYVASRSIDENPSYEYTYQKGRRLQKSYSNANLSLRVANTHYTTAVESIKQIIENKIPSKGEHSRIGKVTSVSSHARDVTDEFVDNVARADTLDASRKALQLLLAKADDVASVVKVHTELNRLTQQSESLRRRALDLKQKSQLSEINVNVEEWRSSDIDDDSTGTQDPLRSVRLAWKHLSWSFAFAFDTLTYALVWMLPCFAFYLVVMSCFTKMGIGTQHSV
jgi:hypothetical protein